MSRSPGTHRRRPQRRGGRRVGPVMLPALLLVVAVLAAPAATRPAAADTTGPVDDTSTPADDETDDDTVPVPRLVVTELEGVVGPISPSPVLPEEELDALPSPDAAARLLVENPTDEPLERVRIVVEVGDPVADRAALREGLRQQTSFGRRLRVVIDEPLGTITAGDVAQVRVTVPGDEAAFAPSVGSTSEPIRVVPVRIAVVTGATVLDEVRTAVVGLSGAEVAPLETTLLLPIDHEPAATPGGSGGALGTLLPDTATAEEPTEEPTEAADEDPEAVVETAEPDPALLPGGRVDELVRAVEAVPPGAVAIAPAVHTLEALEAVEPTAPGAAALLDRIRSVAAADRGGVVSTPLMLTSVPTLASDEDTTALAATAVSGGRRRLGAALGVAAGAPHLAVATQTPSSLDLVPGDLLVTRWDDAAGVDLAADPEAELPPAVRTAVAPSGRALQVLVGDPWIEAALAGATGAHGAVVDAHRVVAETAVVWAQRADTAGRPLAVVPPLAWEPRGDLAVELTTRLASATWLRLASPSTVVQRADPRGTGWSPTPADDETLAPFVRRIAAADARIRSLALAVDDRSTLDVESAQDELLRALTAWPTSSRTTRTAATLDAVDEALDQVAGTTTVPADTTVTLASERGVVPVTVRREEGPPLDVLVEITPQGRLVVEDDAIRAVELDSGGTATVGFETRALGTGTIPVEVRVLTPDRGLVLANANLPVRATAVSTPALVGVGVVVLLLLLLGRRRRSGGTPQRPRLEVVK